MTAPRRVTQPRRPAPRRPAGHRSDRRPADHLTARRCDCGVCRALARRCRWLVRRVGGSVAGRRRVRASVAP
ncbi:hypothetical protein [Kitasatospora purpeofusca]|uniref:hypothetical protein n=1 Tax=Kitasatospora purpeofusca TaxID=67352 RepID=UPI0038664754|nr:hypothetical protein OIP63_29570 [Kitasatospora purpeofusca]